eukprot:TRINITY_DN9233_c0_g1_i2.p1 TRINITY_DN9233_c0_g1~~TRINITY_DN9233_c0_g1_i2.p1  ORF type:complete len:104 (-),score=4.40 TRINITY_DN9233_c0_g1_i2:16-327(-)
MEGVGQSLSQVIGKVSDCTLRHNISATSLAISPGKIDSEPATFGVCLTQLPAGLLRAVDLASGGTGHPLMPARRISGCRMLRRNSQRSSPTSGDLREWKRLSP